MFKRALFGPCCLVCLHERFVCVFYCFGCIVVRAVCVMLYLYGVTARLFDFVDNVRYSFFVWVSLDMCLHLVFACVWLCCLFVLVCDIVCALCVLVAFVCYCCVVVFCICGIVVRVQS